MRSCTTFWASSKLSYSATTVFAIRESPLTMTDRHKPGLCRSGGWEKTTGREGRKPSPGLIKESDGARAANSAQDSDQNHCADEGDDDAGDIDPVSYTHLTLPTNR